MKIKIFYICWDGGDGSCNPTFYKSQEEVDKALKEAENSEYEEYNLNDSYYEVIDTDDYEVVEN